MKRFYVLLLAFIFAGSFFVNDRNFRAQAKRILCQLTIRLWRISLFVLGTLFLIQVQTTNATTIDIIINEIGAYPTSTHEWIEVWNKGNDPVDLTGWKFWENSTNHTLTATNTTDAIISPGEYAAICQNSAVFALDYPNFTGSIFDSSWSSLAESGEEIGLKDESENFIEQFTYIAAPNFSLERRDPALFDYTANNWQEHGSGNTIGVQNSNFFITINASSTGAAATTTTATSTTTTVTTTASSVPNWSAIKINEFIADPASGDEWVELYNSGSSTFDLAGGTLCDSRTSTSCAIAALAGNISPQNWLTIFLASSHLNNDGDSVLLKDPTGVIIDQITYNGNLLPTKGQALARKIDGADTNNDSVDWAVTTMPTPNASNNITAPVINAPSPSGGSGGSLFFIPVSSNSTAAKTTTTTTKRYATSTTPLFLNELYPNPPGSDSEGEFIELKNSSPTIVNLAGWEVADNQNSFVLTGTLLPNELLVLPRTKTNIALNNSSAEIVRLYDPSGAIADEIQYDRAEEEFSYSRALGQWHWSEEVTRGLPNVIVTADAVDVMWKVILPTGAAPSTSITLSADGSTDPRGGLLSFLWNFGDGTSSTSGATVTHTFTTSGTFIVVINASSTQGTESKKELPLLVGQRFSAENTGIIITEIFVNPVGIDTNEFIELYNAGSSTIDLSGWQLTTEKNKSFTIPNNTNALPKVVLNFARSATHLAVDNNGDKVSLFAPGKQLIDVVRIGPSTAGQSYTLQNNEWRWGASSPGTLQTATTSGQVLGEKISAPTITTKKSTGALPPITRTTFADARSQPSGSYLRLVGSVSALPGTFGTQYFYLTDGMAGLQMYLNKKDFPSLALGDQISASGQLGFSFGVPRLKIKTGNAINKIASGSLQNPPTLTFEDLDSDRLGGLVTVAGEVTRIQSNLLYLDDGEHELAIYLKAAAKINKNYLKEGDKITATGILEQGKNGIELWPRGDRDLVVIDSADQTITNTSKTNFHPYATTTTVGAALIILGLLVRPGFIKRILKSILKK